MQLPSAVQGKLFETEVGFPATREGSLARLAAFVPRAGRYSRDRNAVRPGHGNVSRLSPALRHRLIHEEECIAAPLERYAWSTVEKFTQELRWRSYWKAWLSLRPQVWEDYLRDLASIRAGLNPIDAERVAAAEAGQGPVAIMNHFARELVETGYLHNHARMWFAGWWIHVERLPWQLGADFFFRHLLDADPASNTLSWRWVAGLQTPGKTYLPRRSNLEKYVAEEILSANREGLELLERPTAVKPDGVTRPAITRPELTTGELPAQPWGLWVHEEDLLPERGPTGTTRPEAVLVAGAESSWDRGGFSGARRQWMREALDDAGVRAGRCFGTSERGAPGQALTEVLPAWVERSGIRSVVAVRPEVGVIADELPAVETALAGKGVELILLDRPEDLALRKLATAGFFGFWKKVEKLTRPQGG